jgi:hypothetical protein
MGPRRAPPEPLSLRGSDLGCGDLACNDEYSVSVPANTVFCGRLAHLRANAAKLV